MSSYKAKLREAHAHQLKFIKSFFPDEQIPDQSSSN